MTEGCRYRSHYNPFNVFSPASFSPDPEGDLIEYSEYQKLEAENSKLKVAVEQARADALSNLERLISVEAENKRLREALRDIEVACNICGLPEPRGIPLGALSESVHEIARRALGGEG